LQDLTSSDVLKHFIIMKSLNKGSICTDLKPFAPVLNDEQKEQVVGAMVAVSLADGKQ